MRNIVLGLPAFAFVVGTRAALGVGIGLLVAARLSDRKRRTIGATLVGVGAATTIPAALSVVRSLRRLAPHRSRVEHDNRLVGATRFPRKGDDDDV